MMEALQRLWMAEARLIVAVRRSEVGKFFIRIISAIERRL